MGRGGVIHILVRAKISAPRSRSPFAGRSSYLVLERMQDDESPSLLRPHTTRHGTHAMLPIVLHRSTNGSRHLSSAHVPFCLPISRHTTALQRTYLPASPEMTLPNGRSARSGVMRWHYCPIFGATPPKERHLLLLAERTLHGLRFPFSSEAVVLLVARIFRGKCINTWIRSRHGVINIHTLRQTTLILVPAPNAVLRGSRARPRRFERMRMSRTCKKSALSCPYLLPDNLR